MKPIPLKTIAEQLRVQQAHQALVQGVAIDSRHIRAGELFFALPGARVDGHDFIEAAAAKGAVGAVVSEAYRGETFGLPLLHVPDVLLALQALARIHLQTRTSKVIAISGSLGKTTTKAFTTALLQTEYSVFSSPRSYNSQATVPLSILMAEGDEAYLILEMGMSQKGELSQLVSIAPPDIALLTTISVQHADHFSDGLAGISREKAALLSHPKTRLGIIPRDISHFDAVQGTGSCEKKTFSMSGADADYRLEPCEGGVRITGRGEAAQEIPLNLPLKVHYHNFLAAVAVARTVGLSWEAIRAKAPHLRLPDMRFEQVVKQGIIFINDAYNANPDSMKAALESLPKPAPGGRVIAVLSEMNALGMYTEGGHALVAETALYCADLLLCIGGHCDTMRKIWKRDRKPVSLYETRSDLEAALVEQVKPGDVVLLKGARAYALDKILDRF